MRIETAADLTVGQKEIVTRLWNAEYPKQLNYGGVAEFEKFLNGISNRRHFLLFDENKKIKGWLVTFTRENEHWFSIIIDNSEQKKGYGTTLLNELKKYENDINGWVIERDDYLKCSGEKYPSPIEFYRKNGFLILPGVRLEKDDFYAIKINWKK